MPKNFNPRYDDEDFDEYGTDDEEYLEEEDSEESLTEGDVPARERSRNRRENDAKFSDSNEDWDEGDDPIADLLYEIVTRMGFKDVDIEWEERPDHVRYFIEGEDMGVLIGRRGATLEALQYLAGVINSRNKLVSPKIIVDIEGYRERREGRLRRLAQRIAEEAISSGQEIVLDPMPSSDRRVIHLALSNNPQVETVSEGKEPERCLVVIPRLERR